VPRGADQSDIAADLVVRREAAACFSEAGDSIRARIELYNPTRPGRLGAYEDMRARRGPGDPRVGVAPQPHVAIWLSRGLLAESCRGWGARPRPSRLREIADEFRRNQSGRKEGANLIALAGTRRW
jgi:hypothetical protein